MSSLLAHAGRTAHVAPPNDSWSWNCEHGRLSARDSAMPGRWRSELAPHLRYWHDVVSARRLGRNWTGAPDQHAHLTEAVWMVAAAQSFKTRSLLYAALAYSIDEHPAPSGFILPRLKDFKRVLKGRIRPFFEDTPQLLRHFPVGIRDRKEKITYEGWTLDTMTLYMLCGELPDDLRQFPLRDLYIDEFDLLPLDADGEGDPIEIVTERQKTWPRSRLTIGTTTCTTVANHGWRRLCGSTHQRLMIECPACSGIQELHPDQLRTPDASPDEIKLERLAQWACKHCGSLINDDGTKEQLITAAAKLGRWIPGRWEVSAKAPKGGWTPRAAIDGNGRLIDWQPPRSTSRSGQMNALYSPFVTLSEFAAKERQVTESGGREAQITFRNTWRCEPTLPQATIAASVDQIHVATSGADYQHGECPDGPLHVATICDQQGNQRQTSWFPYCTFGYAPGNMWLIETGDMTGFETLEAAENRRYPVGNKVMQCELTTVDGNNGTMRVPLQQYAAAKPEGRLLMTGRAFPNFMFQQRIAGKKEERRNKKIISGARIFSFHSNAYKSEADQCLRGTNGRLALHLPTDCPDFFMRSMSAEEGIERDMRLPGMHSKRRVVSWELRVEHSPDGNVVVRSDNHWWDALVMAIALGDINGWLDPVEPQKETVTLKKWFGAKHG